MKFLIGLSQRVFGNDKSYRMFIVDIDEITNEIKSFDWEELDVEKLNECVNIRVNIQNFKNNIQNPSEYIDADFDIERLNCCGGKQKYFQITNVYYDEFNQPQLYRAVNLDGYVSMHDISELEYRKAFSILGETLKELPPFVKKEPLSSAYEWWKAKEEASKKSEDSFFSEQFEVYESMPVKILYHYLTGVKGFEVGYHTQTKINEGYLSEIQHEYLLYKDTANIKLRESVPVEDTKYSFYYDYGMLGDKDPYPDKRMIKYYGAEMSIICNNENYPTFDIYRSPSSQFSCDKDGIVVGIDYRNGLLHIYNKLEASGCISKDWRLSEYRSLFGMTNYSLLPEELALLSAKLQSQKEGTIYNHVMSATHGHWSTFNTDDWIRTSILPIATQFYSPELRKKLSPIFENYQTLYIKELRKLIEEMGAKDALETMKWTKKASKEALKNISLVKPDGSLQKANVDVVDQMSNLYTYKRNNYFLPDWLQIYSPQTIEALGGVELLQELIAKRGEKVAKESIQILAEGIESERRYELRNQGKQFIQPEEIISIKNVQIEQDDQIENASVRRK